MRNSSHFFFFFFFFLLLLFKSVFWFSPFSFVRFLVHLSFIFVRVWVRARFVIAFGTFLLLASSPSPSSFPLLLPS